MAARLTYLPPKALDTLQRLELVARDLVEGGLLGLHRSPFRGFSPEFAEYREYTPGDNVKYVDWKTCARTDRCYVKCFEEESNLNGYVLLDTSASMAMPDQAGRPVKFRYAAALAAAFLYLFRRQHDAGSLMTWSDHVGECTECGTSLAHFLDCMRRLEALKPGGASDAAPCLESLAERIPRRAMVLIFSDFLDRRPDFYKSLARLLFNRCEIILFQVMNADELEFPYAGIVRFKDPESGQTMELDADGWRAEYLAGLDEWNRRLRAFCDSRHVTIEPVSTALPFERALAAYFARREAMLK